MSDTPNEGAVPAAVPADITHKAYLVWEATLPIKPYPMHVAYKAYVAGYRDALATSAPPPVEAREALPPLPEPVFVVQGSGLLAPMGFSAKQMLDYVRADRDATHPKKPTEAGGDGVQGIRYTSWCDKHSRMAPCDRCAAEASERAAGPLSREQIKQAEGMAYMLRDEGEEQAADTIDMLLSALTPNPNPMGASHEQ
jgi:hypothetical protein